jgi:hypothetical protein
LIAQDGGPNARRGAALLRSLAGTNRSPIKLEDLADVPDWLRLPPAALRALAERTALVSMAPALARTIDGELLDGHAKIAGEQAVDWAIGCAGKVPDGGLPPIEAKALAARGFALMGTVLPERLRPLLGPECEDGQFPSALAGLCVAEAVQGARAA